MKRATVLMVLVACGGDDTGARPDVLINPGPTYDLSCLGNMRSSIPPTITFDSTVYDFTGTTANTPVANATITTYSLSDDAMLAMNTTDMDGKAMVEIQTGGTAKRIYSVVEAAGFVPSRHYVNVAPWDSGPGVSIAIKQSRIDDLATALGVTPDPTKGVLEVWAHDCSTVGELPGASLQLDGAPTQFAMFGGVGVWIPRETTLGTVSTLRNGSVAGIANLTPGLHTVTLTAGSLSLTSTVGITAGGWSVLVMVPGHPLN